MIFQVLQNHLLRHVTGTKGRVSDGPEVPPPVRLAQLRELLLHAPRRAPFQPADDVAHRQIGRVADVQMDMVFADTPAQYCYVMCFTDLADQSPNPQPDFLSQDTVAVFGNPHQMYFEVKDCMRTFSIFSHEGENTKVLG